MVLSLTMQREMETDVTDACVSCSMQGFIRKAQIDAYVIVIYVVFQFCNGIGSVSLSLFDRELDIL